MITDEEIADLPEDPQLAFVTLERILRERVQEEERHADQNHDVESFRIEYINRTVAAAKIYDIDALSQWKVPRVGENIYRAYIQFTHDVDYVTMQIRIQTAPQKKRGSVGLDQNDKTKIHHYIGNIKEIVDKSDLIEDKKDKLYEKLNDLALEVDKNRTRLETVAAVFMTLCSGIGQGFSKLEPARRWLDSIATVMERAKDLENIAQPKIPPPSARKRLEAPRKQLPESKALTDELDDDIPF